MLKEYFSTKVTIEAGCDEAGRGCLAGPVFAAAVILPPNFKNELLDDSKKINEKNRNILREIIEKEALYWAVGTCSPLEIDKINILNASILSMHRALDGLKQKPELILVDGNKFKPYHDIPYETIIKGDGKMMSIAAASILAKTHRDEYMQKIHLETPYYDWNKNKGYPTKFHKKAIAEHGTTIHHRMTFNMTEQLKLKV
ncbi:ribonuclease HII [Lentimicrobium sp. L6]|uniref:ribonuclease HII n=1 Tax=Lentimicrobium sp. L6 TaxID=2735916 RepID=UPI0015551752|nr:ribonuclease HII [Lentimicrobium sp. L6]NPD86002.1 ribonuclease HII [Lentimicrobium sp. L6]